MTKRRKGGGIAIAIGLLTQISTKLNRQQTSTLLKISAILWVIWGVVHAFAGVLTISQETAGVIAGIADGVDSVSLAIDYPDAAGAVVNQHGFNLLWAGMVTIIRWRIYLARQCRFSSNYGDQLKDVFCSESVQSLAAMS